MSSLAATAQRNASGLGAPSSASAAAGIINPALEECLTSLLASPDFSVSRYLNLALALADDPPADADAIVAPEEREHRLEQQMASIALQLQMRTQSCHDEIGRIGAELQAIVPRCAADVGRLRVGLEGMELDVRGLLEGMDSHASGSDERKISLGSEARVGADVGAGTGGENRADDPLATLATLLNLRTHLTTSRAILSAASSWDETINSIPMLLSTTPPNLVEAIAALSQLERGARALGGMPEGRDEREAALRKLRSQLEVLLKPQLLHALKRMDTRLGPLQQCVGMYDSLGKMDVMREEYVKMRPGEVHALWFSFGGGAKDSKSAMVKKDGEESKKKELGEGEGEEEVEDFDFDETDAADPVFTAPTSSQNTAEQFIEFLPKFYEAVLAMLAEERTQSQLVFGLELAPSIVVRVLIECFKPIVNSFEKRLGNLCPPPGRLDGGDDMGGMGTTGNVAAAYESTVQFLSLAYGQIAAWSGPPKNKGVTKEVGKNNPLEATVTGDASPDPADGSIQSLLRTAILLVARPFFPYQRRLSDWERDPLGEAAAVIARDVRSVAVSWEDAAERLWDLAPFVFPLAEATIHRFEILNSGYNALPALSSVDLLISDHASELAIAMGTLSNNASSSASAKSSGGGGGSDFDERHVNCALEILRVAGMFKRNLRSFERSVRDRLRKLSRVMMDATALLRDNDYMVPDELAPVQIRALLAREACDPKPTFIDDGTGVKRPAAAVELRRLATPANSSDDSNVAPLFPKAHGSTLRLARSCLSFVFEVCYSTPEQELRGISALPVWKQEGGDGNGDGETLYGILPQPFITHVGEHMLALVQALEPFASDAEALGLANEVMEGVVEVAVQPWREFVAATGCSFNGMDEKSTLEALMQGKDLEKYFFDAEDDNNVLDESVGEREEEKEDAAARASTAFCNSWLDAVGSAVTGRLLERAMRIPRLGHMGAQHLATDLNYVRNVFAALGVVGHPHPLLGHMAGLATEGEGVIQERILRRREGENAASAGMLKVLEIIKQAELRIAYVRGISV